MATGENRHRRVKLPRGNVQASECISARWLQCFQKQRSRKEHQQTTSRRPGRGCARSLFVLRYNKPPAALYHSVCSRLRSAHYDWSAPKAAVTGTKVRRAFSLGKRRLWNSHACYLLRATAALALAASCCVSARHPGCAAGITVAASRPWHREPQLGGITRPVRTRPGDRVICEAFTHTKAD